MRRLGSGAGCGACGRGSHPRTREAGGHRPGLLRGSAFNGWTRTGKGGRKLAGALSRKHGPPDRNAAVARRQAPRFAAMRIASQPPTRACRRAAPLVVSREGLPQTSGAPRRETKSGWLFDIWNRQFVERLN